MGSARRPGEFHHVSVFPSLEVTLRVERWARDTLARWQHGGLEGQREAVAKVRVTSQEPLSVPPPGYLSQPWTWGKAQMDQRQTPGSILVLSAMESSCSAAGSRLRDTCLEGSAAATAGGPRTLSAAPRARVRGKGQP